MEGLVHADQRYRLDRRRPKLTRFCSRCCRNILNKKSRCSLFSMLPDSQPGGEFLGSSRFRVSTPFGTRLCNGSNAALLPVVSVTER